MLFRYISPVFVTVRQNGEEKLYIYYYLYNLGNLMQLGESKHTTFNLSKIWNCEQQKNINKQICFWELLIKLVHYTIVPHTKRVPSAINMQHCVK